jgi:hypothetical protein
MKIPRHRKLNRKSSRRSAKTRPTDGAIRDAKRDASTGRFGPGNSIARKADGVNRFQKTRELPEDVRAFVEEFSAAVLSDQGGASELSAIRGGYVRRITDAEALIQLCSKDIRSRGVFTVGGRTRSTVFTLMKAVDQWDRLAQRLGLDRRAKQVPSLEQFLQQREGDQE